MTKKHENKMSRRTFAATAVAATGFGSSAWAEFDGTAVEAEILAAPATVKRNISSFRAKTWQPYFANLKNGVCLADTKARVLHFWSEDESIYRLYPTSVPASPELTRLGRTSVIRKRIGPDWRPTPNMLKRNPDWPRYVPPGPLNPLGTHALYLSWQYYRIHGNGDTRKVGRRSSNGCIGLYNEQIAELFELTKVGTQVLLI
jgi:L,D-transpeptidase ErfK/SrfK